MVLKYPFGHDNSKPCIYESLRDLQCVFNVCIHITVTKDKKCSAPTAHTHGNSTLWIGVQALHCLPCVKFLMNAVANLDLM